MVSLSLAWLVVLCVLAFIGLLVVIMFLAVIIGYLVITINHYRWLSRELDDLASDCPYKIE